MLLDPETINNVALGLGSAVAGWFGLRKFLRKDSLDSSAATAIQEALKVAHEDVERMSKRLIESEKRLDEANKKLEEANTKMAQLMHQNNLLNIQLTKLTIFLESKEKEDDLGRKGEIERRGRRQSSSMSFKEISSISEIGGGV